MLARPRRGALATILPAGGWRGARRADADSPWLVWEEQTVWVLRCWGGRRRGIAKRAKVWLLKVKHGAAQVELKRVGIDTSKAVFTVHGIDAQGRPVLRRNFSRAAVEAFFGKLAPTEVALEACGGSHHWGRVLAAMGHRVRLIPAQYVKPFAKRGKNDRNDAEAICEAAGRPGMASVPVKTAQRQADAMIVGARALLVRQHTQLINALCRHAAAFGLVAARGPAMSRLRQLLVLGAIAVIRYAKPGSKTASAWLLKLLERRPRKLAAVALANKIARAVWAMMARGKEWRGWSADKAPAAA